MEEFFIRLSSCSPESHDRQRNRAVLHITNRAIRLQRVVSLRPEGRRQPWWFSGQKADVVPEFWALTRRRT